MAFTIQDAIASSKAYREENSKSSNSSFLEEYTIEQIKQEANCSVFEVVPPSTTNKCFFICGDISGPVSNNIEKQLFVEGKNPKMKVVLVEKTETDSFGGPWKGLQLVEDKPREGSILL